DDVITLRVRNHSKKGYVNGTEVLSSTDNAITAIGRGGLGWGGDPLFDLHTDWHLDDFLLDDSPVVQYKTGTSTGSSCAVTLDRAITEGNKLVAVVNAQNQDPGYAMSGTGWTTLINIQPWGVFYVAEKIAGASESTTITFSH